MAKKKTNESQIRLTEAYKNFEEVLAQPLSELLSAGGKLGKLLLALAIVAALYAKFFPTIDEMLSPITLALYPSRSLTPSSIIITISLLSAAIFFLLVLVRFAFKLMKKILRFVGILAVEVYSQLANVLLKLLYVINKKIALNLSRFLYFYKTFVYFNKSWLAESAIEPYEGKRLRIPINIKNFRYARCYVNVLKVKDDHWRAGIIFEGPERQEYIFHAHEDQGSPGILRSRIVLRVPGREIADKKAMLTDIKDVRKFELEVKRVDNELSFLINKSAVGTFEVPLENINNIYFAAWADGRPFKIQFVDIEVGA